MEVLGPLLHTVSPGSLSLAFLILLAWRVRAMEKALNNGFSGKLDDLSQKVEYLAGVCQERGKRCPVGK